MTHAIPHSVAPHAPPIVLDARPIRWWAAPLVLPALVFAPTRIGPRLARSGWAITLAVHVLCLAAALFLTAYAAALVYEPLGNVFWSLVGRAPGDFGAEPSQVSFSLPNFLKNALAAALNMMFVASDSWGDLYGVLGAVAVVHLLHWILAILAMPFIAAGERPRLLLARALKLSLWSSAMLPILAIGLGSYVVGDVHITGKHFLGDLTSAGIVIIWLGWWFSLLTRLGRRYSGPADGPAWRAIEPRCARCRYILAGLPIDGRCPECGLPAVESFSRGGETCPWTGAPREISRPAAWFKVCFGVFRRKDYFAKLEIPLDLPLAIRFLKWSASMIAAVAAALPFVHGLSFRLAENDRPPLIESLTLAAALFVGVRLFVIWFVALLAICWGLRPSRDLRWVAIPACYCSCLGMPLVTLAVVFVAVVVNYVSFEYELSFARKRTFWVIAIAFIVLVVVPFFTCFGLAAIRTASIMRHVAKRLALPHLPG